MPPKVKIEKQNIISAAVEVIRENGVSALNARIIADRAGCSTQPIFSRFSSMEELKSEALTAVKQLYFDFIEKEMNRGKYPPYKASGMAYIRFAREEKELFKFLFMRDRSNETIKDERKEISDIIKIICDNTGFDEETAYAFHIEMWIFVHGIASMIASSYLDWDEETTDKVLSDAYIGIKKRFSKKTTLE